MGPRPGDDDPSEERERVGLDRHLAIFVEESTLWPVLVAAVLALTTGGAALMLLALGDRNLFAIAALLILVWMSVDFTVRRRRLGVVGGFILAFWVLSALAALGFHSLGLF